MGDFHIWRIPQIPIPMATCNWYEAFAGIERLWRCCRETISRDRERVYLFQCPLPPGRLIIGNDATNLWSYEDWYGVLFCRLTSIDWLLNIHIWGVHDRHPICVTTIITSVLDVPHPSTASPSLVRRNRWHYPIYLWHRFCSSRMVIIHCLSVIAHLP